MSDLEIGLGYIVNAENGLDLRKEPNMNSKTEDGTDNIILSLPQGSQVILASDEVRISDGRNWYNVKYIQDDVEEIGWVNSHDLPELGMIVTTGGGGSSYLFQFDGSWYYISDVNLTNAVGQYIANKATSNMKGVFINGAQYYTSPDNIKSMKDKGLILINPRP